MKRSYIYIIVVLLTITLVASDYIIGKDLQKIIPLDEKYRTLEETSTVKEATILTTITIKNEQNTDEEIEYKYSIKAEDLSGAYRYKYNNKEGYIVFTANGESTFNLKGNESIILYDIPIDTVYTITQETTKSEYITKVGQDEKNTYTSKTSTDNNITFNNAKKHEEPVVKEDKKEEPKQETKKEDKKIDKKDVPNTSSKEMTITLILLLSLLIIYFLRKAKIKRFE